MKYRARFAAFWQLLLLAFAIPMPQANPVLPDSAPTPDSPWKKRLPCGALVELIGVTMQPRTEQKWTTPDGAARLIQPPLDPQPERRLGVVFTEPVEFEALFHLTRLPIGSRIVCELEYRAQRSAPAYSLAGTDEVSVHGSPYGTFRDRLYLVHFGCRAPKGAKATIRVGLRLEAAQQVAAWNADAVRGQPVGADGDTPLSIDTYSRTRNGGLQATLSLPRRHGPLRAAGSADYDFIARKKDGSEVEGAAEDSQGENGPPLKVTFPALALTDVVRFRLVMHAYQWVSFENVSLRDL